MKEAAQPTSETLENGELGAKLGHLNSTSEGFQMLVLGAAVIGGLAASGDFLGAGIPTIVWIIGGALLSLAVVVVAKQIKWFNTSMTIYENGMEISVKGKAQRFLYTKVERYSTKHTHHYNRVAGKDVYIGSRVVTDVIVDGRFRSVRWDSEYHAEKSTRDTVRLAAEKLCTAVELRLAHRLESEGEVPLSTDVFLTLDGLRIVDRVMDSERHVEMDQIACWQASDDEIKLFQPDSGLPFLSLPTDGENIAPAFSLFAKLHESLIKADVEAEAELVS